MDHPKDSFVEKFKDQFDWLPSTEREAAAAWLYEYTELVGRIYDDLVEREGEGAAHRLTDEMRRKREEREAIEVALRPEPPTQPSLFDSRS